MRSLFSVCIFLISISHAFCQESIPEGYVKITTTHDNGEVVERIEKKRTPPNFKPRIFIAEKTYIYSALYLGPNNDTLSNETIIMQPTGKPWDQAPETQTVAHYIFNFSRKNKITFTKNPINKSLDKGSSWIKDTVEGVGESPESVWIHPFRSNQYIFTEVAPFPEAILPLYVGNSWTVDVDIAANAWGDWKNSKVTSTYKVVAKEDKKYSFGALKDCWKIQAEGTFKGGDSELVAYFHPEYGFVEMNYKNYLGQKLLLVMQDVKVKK
jgi:hypothetical protein